MQEVERSGNNGVWVRNVKLRTKLQQTQLNKVLKRLEARKLIKPVRSVAFKNRRMYMAYHLQVREAEAAIVAGACAPH